MVVTLGFCYCVDRHFPCSSRLPLRENASFGASSAPLLARLFRALAPGIPVLLSITPKCLCFKAAWTCSITSLAQGPVAFKGSRKNQSGKALCFRGLVLAVLLGICCSTAAATWSWAGAVKRSTASCSHLHRSSCRSLRAAYGAGHPIRKDTHECLLKHRKATTMGCV